MGKIIGILSTFILVSTLSTLIFAVIAYMLSRRRRSGVNSAEIGLEEAPLPEEAGTPASAPVSVRHGVVDTVDEPRSVFRRVVSTEAPPPAAEAPPENEATNNYRWT